MPATSSPATAVRYRDVAAAVDWLCTAFGFEKQTVVAGENQDVEVLATEADAVPENEITD